MKNLRGRVATIAATLGLLASTAWADEIVHFTNGAEMPVRSHTVDKENSMVKLDLGGNSSISFPMSMVDKIVSSGQDVFRNPVFHPANQAIAGIPGSAVADTTIRGTAAPVGFRPQPDGKGNAGVMLGEVADAIPAGSPGGPKDDSVVNTRKRFNPAFPPTPGGPAHVIMPNNPQVKPPVQFQMRPSSIAEPIPPPPPPPAPQDDPPADPQSEDAPDNS